MLSSIVLNFCITLSSKNLTDDSTVATLAFSRVSTHCSPFHISVFRDLMSHPIAWFKLLNLALKSLNLPLIWLNLASNPQRIPATVCKFTGSCSFCACTRCDIPSAWSMLTLSNCSPSPGKAPLPGFPSVGHKTGCKLEVSSCKSALIGSFDPDTEPSWHGAADSAKNAFNEALAAWSTVVWTGTDQAQ